MAMPIQAAPIDRSNRAITTQATRVEGISPSLGAGDIPKIICMLCEIFPQIPVCPVLCPKN